MATVDTIQTETQTDVKPMTEVPGPPKAPIFGAKWARLRYAADPVAFMDYRFKKYGRVAGIVQGSLLSPRSSYKYVMVHGPDINRVGFNFADIFHKVPMNHAIMSRTGHTHPRQDALARWGTGLFDLNGAAHKEHRRLMMPAFHRQRLNGYIDDMVMLTQEMLDRWTIGETRDVSADIMQLTLLIASKTLLGADFDDRGQYLGNLFQEMLRLGLSPVTILMPYDYPGFNYHKLLNTSTEAEGYLRKIIANKKASEDDGTVLSMLIRARYDDSEDGLSDDEVIRHAGVIFGAGHETSSNTLTWTLFLLSQFPDVARKLYEEVDSVLQGSPPTIEALDKLTYTDWIIKESMRVLPTVIINERILAEDAEVGGYLLKAGMHLHLSLYHLHKQEDLYPQPFDFKPERWETLKPSPYEYCPFGAGHRMCIGASFAMLELKVVLSMIMQFARLQAIPGTVIDRKGTLTVAPRGGLPVIIQPTDGKYERGVGGIKGQIREMVNLPE